jgi:hypothetical protein
LKPLKTFWELISGEYPDSIPEEERDNEEFIINIPIIQRDYAQGRKSEKQRRDLFLKELSDCIKGARSLHLEFIYGRVIKDDNIKDEKGKEIPVFSPIDGQQRLTTLYLLHWYAGLKEKKIGKIPENFKKLKNFIYDTRLSSRAFCEALVEEDIVLPDPAEGKIKKIITSSYWFRDSWNNDPTIKAMLIMIKAIHKMFSKTDGIWHKLTKERKITFHILNMSDEGFKLNDELYIKMNSRGKELTKFEIFKANFINFLETKYKNKYFCVPKNEDSNGEISYNNYFSFRIEKEWADLFWEHRDANIIDDYFMKYIEFISQLLYFFDNSGENVRAGDFDVNNFNQIEEIYLNNESFICNDDKNNDRVAFLFKSLNLFYTISLINNKVKKESLNNFFKKLFYFSDSENENYDNMKIKVDNEDQINLFERCLKNNTENNSFQIKDRIILFSIIAYCLKFNLTKFSDKDYLNIIHFVRVIRNLLQAQRQERDLSFGSDLSIVNFKIYWRLINELLEPEIYKILPDHDRKFTNSTDKINKQLKEEIIKAELINSSAKNIQSTLFMLEDFHYFEGLIHVLSVDKNKDKLIEYLKAIKEIWSKDNDTLIVQAMIACGFFGFLVKEPDYGAARARYFGRKKNWDCILTNDEDEEKITKYIIKLLDNYISMDKELPAKEKLKKIISAAFNNYSKKEWQYYFLRYSEMLDNIDNYYYFAFYKDNDLKDKDDNFNVRLLGTTSVRPLVAKHINAYARVICKNREVKNYCDEDKCKSVNSEISPLTLKNGLELFCEKKGWRLDINKIDSGIKSNLQSAMDNYKISDSDYILRDYNNLDRIQTVIEFIKDITKNTG